MTLAKLRQITFLVALSAAVSFALTAVVYFDFYWRAGQTEIIFLDVGQGDSILIKTSRGQNILIDGGRDRKVLDRLGRNLNFFDRTIDLVIATHPDADHIGGLVPVLNRYDVSLFLDSGVSHSSRVYIALQDMIEQNNIPVRHVASRQIYDFGEDLFLDIIYPDDSFRAKDVADRNAASIVAKFTDKEIDIMLTGDATKEVENYLVGKFGGYLKSEILKAGHHGSDTSSSGEFLDAVLPEACVISAGIDNSYGHPDLRVINRFLRRGVGILQTSELKDISLVSDGDFIELK